MLLLHFMKFYCFIVVLFDCKTLVARLCCNGNFGGAKIKHVVTSYLANWHQAKPQMILIAAATQNYTELQS